MMKRLGNEGGGEDLEDGLDVGRRGEGCAGEWDGNVLVLQACRCGLHGGLVAGRRYNSSARFLAQIEGRWLLITV